MKKSKTETMLEKLKNGETVICPKCKMGVIVYSMRSGHRFPDVYCNNTVCKAKLRFN